MRKELLAATARNGGVISREMALAIAPRHVVADAVTDGALERMFPRVYALPEVVNQRHARRHGALLFLPDAALSHVDALATWDVPGEAARPDEPIHLTRPGNRSNVKVRGLEIHRRKEFAVETPLTVIRHGARVVRLEQAIVESWPLISDVDQRAPAIVAVRERRTTAARLIETLDRQPQTPGAADMRQLFELLSLGIHSHLEAWGHVHVFSDPRLPPSRTQVPVTLPNGRKVYLDRLFDAEMVNVELDGAAYHGARGQRERDLRRDSALAALGYLTIRFSHLRLHGDATAAVSELLATLVTRRQQLGIRHSA